MKEMATSSNETANLLRILVLSIFSGHGWSWMGGCGFEVGAASIPSADGADAVIDGGRSNLGLSCIGHRHSPSAGAYSLLAATFVHPQSLAISSVGK